MTRAARRMILEWLTRGVTLRLFVNAREPKDGDVASDYHEPTAHYRPIGLTPDDWKIIGDRATAKATFAFTGPAGDVQGWMLTRGDVLLHAERLIDGEGKYDPFPVRLTGDELEVTTRLELKRA